MIKSKLILIIVNIILTALYFRSYFLNNNLNQQVNRQANYIDQIEGVIFNYEIDNSDNITLTVDIKNNKEILLVLHYTHYPNQYLFFDGYTPLTPAPILQKYEEKTKIWKTIPGICGTGISTHPLLREKITWKQYPPNEKGVYRYALPLGYPVCREENEYDYNFVGKVYTINSNSFSIN